MGWTYRVRRCWCGKAAVDGTYCAEHYRKPEESLPTDPQFEKDMEVARKLGPQVVVKFLFGEISREELYRMAGIDQDCTCYALPDGRECTCPMCRYANEDHRPIPWGAE